LDFFLSNSAAGLPDPMAQARAFDLCAAEFVGEDALASGLVERVELHFEILVTGRDSGVSNPHRLNPSLQRQILDTRIEIEHVSLNFSLCGTYYEGK
jgi:hypothetical protein